MHLTKRENQVLELVARGEKQAAIASALGIHRRTVEFHLVNIRKKSASNSTIHAVVTLAPLSLWFPTAVETHS
jgi:DNA-binding NarL/FixJ family response regulator